MAASTCRDPTLVSGRLAAAPAISGPNDTIDTLMGLLFLWIGGILDKIAVADPRACSQVQPGTIIDGRNCRPNPGATGQRRARRERANLGSRGTAPAALGLAQNASTPVCGLHPGGSGADCRAGD